MASYGPYSFRESIDGILKMGLRRCHHFFYRKGYEVRHLAMTVTLKQTVTVKARQEPAALGP